MGCPCSQHLDIFWPVPFRSFMQMDDSLNYHQLSQLFIRMAHSRYQHSKHM